MISFTVMHFCFSHLALFSIIFNWHVPMAIPMPPSKTAAEDECNVQFLVGKGNEKELLPAHKDDLAAHSTVFNGMFRCDDGNAKVVDIDADVDAFKMMLNFIYWGDLSGVNGNNAVAVLCTAHEFGVTELANALSLFPMEKLANVFLAYAQAKALNEKKFAQRCMDYICQNAESLQHSDAFLQIDQHLLSEILGHNQLMVRDDMSIRDAAFRWTNAQCKMKGTEECLAGNRRQLSGPMPDKIIGTEQIPPAEQSNRKITGTASAGLGGNDSSAETHSPHTSSAGNFKTNGSIELVVENVSKYFRNTLAGRKQHSHSAHVGGLSWNILATCHCGRLAIYLQYIKIGGDGHEMKRKCTATLKIVSQRKGAKDYIKKSRKSKDIVDSCNTRTFFLAPFTYQELIDNGWCNKENDSLTVFAEINAEAPTAAAES